MPTRVPVPLSPLGIRGGGARAHGATMKCPHALGNVSYRPKRQINACSRTWGLPLQSWTTRLDTIDVSVHNPRLRGPFIFHRPDGKTIMTGVFRPRRAHSGQDPRDGSLCDLEGSMMGPDTTGTTATIAPDASSEAPVANGATTKRPSMRPSAPSTPRNAGNSRPVLSR